MHRIWKDAEVPVEYHGPPLNLENIGKIGFFGNLLTTISPLVVVILSLVFVKLSFYVAPKTITVSDSPVLHQPKHCIVVGHGDSEEEGFPRSFLYAQLPLFENKRVFMMRYGGSMEAYVTETGVLDVTFNFPLLENNCSSFGDDCYGLTKSLVIFIPASFNFPNIEGRTVHTLIEYQVSSSNGFNNVDYYGHIRLNQRRAMGDDEPYANETMETFLSNELVINATTGFTIENFRKIFESSAFKVTLSTTGQSVRYLAQDRTIAHLALRIPKTFVEVEAPFWNMFKNTYVELFYWFWLIYYLWHKFLSMGFRYGIIPATVKYPLKGSKEHAD